MSKLRRTVQIKGRTAGQGEMDLPYNFFWASVISMGVSFALLGPAQSIYLVSTVWSTVDERTSSVQVIKDQSPSTVNRMLSVGLLRYKEKSELIYINLIEILLWTL